MSINISSDLLVQTKIKSSETVGFLTWNERIKFTKSKNPQKIWETKDAYEARIRSILDELNRLSEIVNSTEVLRSNDPEVLDIPLEELNLSVRSFNALRRRGVKTVRDLVSMTEEDIMNVRNFGKRSYDEIIGILEKMGLKLRDSE